MLAVHRLKQFILMAPSVSGSTQCKEFAKHGRWLLSVIDLLDYGSSYRGWINT